MKNILWIQTDEQRTDSLGCYGGYAKTPNIDELAKNGTVFFNHFVQSPVCVPSRVSELTGCYPHQTGVLDNTVHYNHGKWPKGLTTFPECFAESGYATANFGKYHTPHHATWLENHHVEHLDEIGSFLGFNKEYEEFNKENIYMDDELPLMLSGKYPTEYTPVTKVTEDAIRWFSGYQHIRRPFLTRVSFLAPHTPVFAPEPFYSMYHPDQFDWDKPTEEILNNRPAFEKMDDYKAYYSHSDYEFKRMRATYYGLVSHLDDQVGRIINELKRSGDYENTIIVFTSDHGDLMGEYGQFQKGKFYDLTCRVPCIISGGGIPKGKVYDLTESVDLGITLMNLCGIDVPAQFQGIDMFSGRKRENVIGEILMDCRRSWIRTKEYSLDFTSEKNNVPVHFDEYDGKLIDLKNDELFHNNLFYHKDYEHIRNELIATFFERTSENRRPVQKGSGIERIKELK